MYLFKALNIFVLIGFLNMITYFPCYVSESWPPPIVDVIENGIDEDGSDTLLDILLDDVLDIPVSGDDVAPDIFYDDFSFFALIFSLSAKVLDLFLLTVKPLISSLMSRENSFLSAVRPIPGYYNFLFRYKPF